MSDKLRNTAIRKSLNTLSRYFSIVLKDLNLDGSAMLAECLKNAFPNKLYSIC